MLEKDKNRVRKKGFRNTVMETRWSGQVDGEEREKWSIMGGI